MIDRTVARVGAECPPAPASGTLSARTVPPRLVGSCGPSRLVGPYATRRVAAEPLQWLSPMDRTGEIPGDGVDGGARDALAGRSLLLAEDEALVSLDLAMALEDAGAAVVPTYSLATTLEQARTGRFDAAVLDVNLAGAEVFPAATILADTGVPLVFHTGHERSETIAAVYPDAVTLSKPVATEQVVRGVLIAIRRGIIIG